MYIYNKVSDVDRELAIDAVIDYLEEGAEIEVFVAQMLEDGYDMEVFSQ